MRAINLSSIVITSVLLLLLALSSANAFSINWRTPCDRQEGLYQNETFTFQWAQVTNATLTYKLDIRDETGQWKNINTTVIETGITTDKYGFNHTRLIVEPIGSYLSMDIQNYPGYGASIDNVISKREAAKTGFAMPGAREVWFNVYSFFSRL